MVLPYTAGASLLLRAGGGSFDSEDERKKAWSFAVAGGALVGIAFQINPKAALDLVFFAAILWTSRWRRTTEAPPNSASLPESVTPLPERSVSALRLFALSIAGFVAGALP